MGFCLSPLLLSNEILVTRASKDGIPLARTKFGPGEKKDWPRFLGDSDKP